MPDNFLIRFRQNDESVQWMRFDQSGSPVSALGEGSLESLAEEAFQNRVIVLVPATDVLLTSVNIPIRNAARLRQALPYAIEEQLADDLDELHFAIGRTATGSEVPVAVIRRDLLDGYMARLHEAGIEPQAMLGMQATIPGSPTATTWLIDKQCCYFRHPDAAPFVMEGDHVDEFLLFGDPRSGDPEGGAHLTVYLDEQDQERLAEDLEQLRDQLASLEIRLLPDGPLPVLGAQAIGKQHINLLQGEYAPSSGMEKTWRPWRAAAILLLSLIVLTIGKQASALYKLKQQDKELDARIEALFRDAMPDVQRIVNPRAQMESRLVAVRAASGGTDAPFLTALDAISRAVNAAPNARIEAMSFRNGVTELKLSVPGVDTLDQIQKLVSADGRFEASILSANPRGDGVEGRLQVSVKGA